MSKKNILNIICILLIATFGLTAQNRIAVLPFTADKDISVWDAVRATDVFASELANNRYSGIVVPQTDVYKALTDIKYRLATEFDNELAAEVGVSVNADIVFVGHLTKNGSKKKLNFVIKAIDAHTAEQIFCQTGIVQKEKNMTIEQYNVKSVMRYIISNHHTMTANYTNTAGTRGFLPVAGIAMAVSGGVLATIGGILLGTIYPLGYMYHSLSGDWYYGYNAIRQANLDGTKLTSDSWAQPWPAFIGMVAGIALLPIGVLIASLSAIPFLFSPRVKSGDLRHQVKLNAFLRRMNISGGYDIITETATVAMSVKL